MQKRLSRKNILIIFLIVSLALCIACIFGYTNYSNAHADGETKASAYGMKETRSDINVTSYLLKDSSGYYESEKNSAPILGLNLINLSIYAQSAISSPEVRIGGYMGYRAFGISGQSVVIRLTYNYSYPDNLLRTSNDIYSIAEEDSESIGDCKIGVIGNGALLVQKKFARNDEWQWQTKDGETKNNLNTTNFTELVRLSDYNIDTKRSYLLYTPSGDDLTRGVFLKITFAYRLKNVVKKKENGFLGIPKETTTTTYHNVLETAEFYVVQNSGTVLFHNVSNFGQVGEESESGAFTADNFDTILDGDVTLNGFRLDTLGVSAYDITYKRNNEATDHKTSDGKYFFEQGRYDFTIQTKLDNNIKHTIFVDRREINDAIADYFGNSLFTPDSKRIYTTGQYPAYLAGAKYHLNATDGTVSPLVGRLYKVTEKYNKVEEHLVEDITPDINADHSSKEFSKPILEVGQYKAEFWNNSKILDEKSELSGDILHFVFRFEIVDADTNLDPSINQAYLNGLIGFSDLNSKYYSVSVPTKGAGNAIFAFADYGGAYDFAYDLERENISKTNKGYEYKGIVYKTQYDVLGAIDIAAKSRVVAKYFDATDPTSYQTADIDGEKLTELNYDSDIIIFINDTEQNYLKAGLPFLNGRKYRYIMPADAELNGASPISEGVLPFAFVKVDDFETQSITLTHVDDPTITYSIVYGTSVEYQLGLKNAPSGKYKISEHNANNGDSEYEAIYIKPGDMTSTVNVSLYRGGVFAERVFDKNHLNTEINVSGFILKSITNEIDPYSIVKIKHGAETTIYSISEVSDKMFSDGGAYEFDVVDRLGNEMRFSIVITAPVGESNIHLQLDGNNDDVQTEYNVFVGQEIDLPTLASNNELFVFDGWIYNDTLITDGKFAADGSGDLYLWPQFTQKYTYLDFDSNGGISVERIKAEIGKELSLPVTTKDGWKFGGWEYGGNIYSGSYMPTTASHTFVAVWNFIKVDIDLYDGNLLDAITANVGDKVSLPFPTRAGYTFFGWRLDLGNGQNKIYYGQITKLENVEYMRLDALWIHDSTIDQDELASGNGGRTAIYFIDGSVLENDTIVTSVGTNIAMPIPTRAGYVFIGWVWRTTPISGKIYPGETMTVPQNDDRKIVLEALWIARAVNTGAYLPASGSIDENIGGGGTIKSVSDFATRAPLSFVGIILSVAVAAMIAVKLAKKKVRIAHAKQSVATVGKDLVVASVTENSDLATRQCEYKTQLKKTQRLKAFLSGFKLNPLTVTVCTALFLTVLMALTGVMGSWNRSTVAAAETVRVVSFDQSQTVDSEYGEQISGGSFTVDSDISSGSYRDNGLPNSVYSNEEIDAAKERINSFEKIEMTDDEAILYGLIMLNLYSFDYDVFLAYAQINDTRILGYGYTDFSIVSQIDNSGVYYCGAGFVAFPNQRLITTADINKGVKIFDTSLETEQNPDDYGFLLTYSENFGPCCYIANEKYVEYSVKNTNVIYEICDALQVEFMPEKGPVYSYDLGRIIYDPDIGKLANVTATSINTLVDPVIAENEYNRYIAEQTANGYTVDTMNAVYISKDALEAYCLGNQDESFLGIDVQEFYDYERTLAANEYYAVDENGNFIKLEFPHKEDDTKQAWLNRLYGLLLVREIIVVGVEIVAITSIISCSAASAAAPYIMGASIGAAMEVLMQTVIQGKPIKEINWLRVAIAAASGVVSAIPGIGWFGAGMIQGVTEAAMTAVDGGSLEEMVKAFTIGFVTGVVIHGVSKALSKIKFCFAAGTPVLMAAGFTKAIENVHPGDIVKSYNQGTGKIENKRVLQTFENETDEIVTVITNDGQEIKSTPGHRFYANNKWVAAEDLRAGDMLVSVNGEKVVVERIQHEILESPIKVYNFEVQDNNTYIVGNENGVVVHNSACKKVNANGEPYETHHIASDKSIQSGYTKEYKEIFDNAGMDFSDPANKVDLVNHHGRHTNAYKDKVLKKIKDATEGLEPHTKEYTDALKGALEELKLMLIENQRLPYLK